MSELDDLLNYILNEMKDGSMPDLRELAIKAVQELGLLRSSVIFAKNITKEDIERLRNLVKLSILRIDGEVSAGRMEDDKN